MRSKQLPLPGIAEQVDCKRPPLFCKCGQRLVVIFDETLGPRRRVDAKCSQCNLISAFINAPAQDWELAYRYAVKFGTDGYGIDWDAIDNEREG